VRSEFLLDPGVIFLNHGSFGSCPRPVFERYQEWQRELERQPVEFIDHRLKGLLADARAALGAYVSADPDDLVFVPNATSGVNLAARALALEPGDECVEPIAAASFRAQMASLRVPTDDPEALKRRLYDERRIEVPVFARKGEPLLRLSIGPYNEPRDVDALVAALAAQ
jgi:selenocysteine lyase/cysteine desulfurase